MILEPRIRTKLKAYMPLFPKLQRSYIDFPNMLQASLDLGQEVKYLHVVELDSLPETYKELLRNYISLQPFTSKLFL